MEAQALARAQKKCAAERRLIVFIDESGLSERPTRVRTWAPRGCTPVVQFHFNRKHVSAVAGLTRSNFFCPRSLAELKTTARDKLRSGQRRQSIITACCKQAELW